MTDFPPNSENRPPEYYPQSTYPSSNTAPQGYPPPASYPPQPGTIQQYPGPYSYAQRPPKDKAMALILEVLPGLFGFMGFGWIYSGNNTAGFLLLFGFLAWVVVAVIINIVTAGFGCFCTIPINLIAVGISALMLNDYTKKHPELFG